jgi:hypothetical protein
LDEAYIQLANPYLDETWYTDPTYYWYRQCFLEVLQHSGWTAYNCTEGGMLFGDGVEWMALERFIHEYSKALTQTEHTLGTTAPRVQGVPSIPIDEVKNG